MRGEDPALTAIEAENNLHAQLEQVEVDVWVSDGRNSFHVVVRGDAEETHAMLPAGGLCMKA